MSKNHNGFLTYLETGEFTEDFITDYEYWCRRIFRGWNLFIDFEEFYNKCWEEFLLKLQKNPFDPSLGLTFQTYVISTPNAAAQRIWMNNKKYKNHPEVDCDDPIISNSVSVNDDYFSLFEPMIKYAKTLEIEVDVRDIESIYQEDENSFITKVIDWWKLKYEQGYYS